MTFTFTADNAVMTSPNASVDYKAVDANSNGDNDVYDSSTRSTYSIMLKSQGRLIETLLFESVTSTSSFWTVTDAGVSRGPIQLNKLYMAKGTVRSHIVPDNPILRRQQDFRARRSQSRVHA